MHGKAFSTALAVLASTVFAASAVEAQIFPPGGLQLDGVPVTCRAFPTIVTPNIPDTAMFNGQAILLNPVVMGRMPTILKLYTYAHECGHAVGYLDESAADCWAIRLGRNQGWFPPQGFQLLIQMFSNNAGDMTHPPGPMRVQNMMNCYQTP